MRVTKFVRLHHVKRFTLAIGGGVATVLRRYCSTYIRTGASVTGIYVRKGFAVGRIWVPRCVRIAELVNLISDLFGLLP